MLAVLAVLTMEFWVACAIIVFYLALLLLFRWYNLVRPNRLMFDAEVENVRNRIEIRLAQVHCNSTQAQSLKRVKELLNRAESSRSWGRWAEFFFWSSGPLPAAWQNLHDAERELSVLLSAREIKTRLLAVDLTGINDPGAIALAAYIKRVLAQSVPNHGELRALLWQALKFQFDDMETTNGHGINWGNKLNWLNATGLLFILVLILTLARDSQNISLLLMGAVGGLLSRLARTLKVKDPASGVTADKGLTWSLLFLSPITGAFCGWGGVLLARLLAENNVLGTAFKAAKWNNPGADLFTLGLALALGVSERFFDRIVSLVDELGTTPKPSTSGPVTVEVPPAATNLIDLKSKSAGLFKPSESWKEGGPVSSDPDTLLGFVEDVAGGTWIYASQAASRSFGSGTLVNLAFTTDTNVDFDEVIGQIKLNSPGQGNSASSHSSSGSGGGSSGSSHGGPSSSSPSSSPSSSRSEPYSSPQPSPTSSSSLGSSSGSGSGSSVSHHGPTPSSSSPSLSSGSSGGSSPSTHGSAPSSGSSSSPSGSSSASGAPVAGDTVELKSPLAGRFVPVPEWKEGTKVQPETIVGVLHYGADCTLWLRAANSGIISKLEVATERKVEEGETLGYIALSVTQTGEPQGQTSASSAAGIAPPAAPKPPAPERPAPELSQASQSSSSSGGPHGSSEAPAPGGKSKGKHAGKPD